MKSIPPIVYLIAAGVVVAWIVRNRASKALESVAAPVRGFITNLATPTYQQGTKTYDSSGRVILDTSATIVPAIKRDDGTFGCPPGYRGRFYGPGHPNAGQPYCIRDGQ